MNTLLNTLWKPGLLPNHRQMRRRLELLEQIEMCADEDPESLRRALPELRALSWRLSDQPKEVREAAARLVHRIQATQRDARQLPIASAPSASVAEELPIPVETGDRP